MTEFLVTDPCYLASHIDNLISDDDWKKFCDIMYKEFNTKNKVDIESIIILYIRKKQGGIFK